MFLGVSSVRVPGGSVVANPAKVAGLRSNGVDTAPGSYEMIFGKHAFFGYAAAPSQETCSRTCPVGPSRPAGTSPLAAIPGHSGASSR